MKNSQSNVQCRYREKINYRLFDYLINDDLKIPYRFLLELTRFALEIFCNVCSTCQPDRIWDMRARHQSIYRS